MADGYIDRNAVKIKYQQDKKEDLIRSGTDFIFEFYPLLKCVPQEEKIKYLEKVLHSIFFFGGINVLPVKPDEFIPRQLLDVFMEKCPKSFKEYKTHLPTQTPFSIVLELIVKYRESNSVEEALEEWTNRRNQTISNNFISTVVSRCFLQDGTSYYGASLSCFGKMEAKTMIAISCLKTWNKAIGWVVSPCNRGANLKFPAIVHSTAFRVKRKPNLDKLKAPCLKCHNAFANVVYDPQFSSSDTEKKKAPRWNLGNCAECESFSKLLNNDETVFSNTEARYNGTTQPIASITLETKEHEEQIRKIGARSFIFPKGDSLKFFC